VHSREQAVTRFRLAGKLPTQQALFRPAESDHNLRTQITSFVGRQREFAAVKQLLLTSRLLTLRGQPGTGKNRLAVQVASYILDQFQGETELNKAWADGRGMTMEQALTKALGK
jgi:hypothetical protein